MIPCGVPARLVRADCVADAVPQPGSPTCASTKGVKAIAPIVAAESRVTRPVALQNSHTFSSVVATGTYIGKVGRADAVEATPYISVCGRQEHASSVAAWRRGTWRANNLPIADPRGNTDAGAFGHARLLVQWAPAWFHTGG